MATRSSDDRLLEPFIAAGLELVDDGVDGITTSCGFLALCQGALAVRLPVPVATSALLQIQCVQAMLPRDKTVGVLTFDAASLGRSTLPRLGHRRTRRSPACGLRRRSGPTSWEVADASSHIDRSTASLSCRSIVAVAPTSVR